MEIRSTDKFDSKLKKTQVKPSQKVSVETVTVRSCRNVKYVYHSPFTGKRIVFDRAGSQHTVTRDEANDLLSKSRKGCGCGAMAINDKIFEEVT